ncbi:hypothetical protein GH714_017834 [Hevea brasiliensis]|uniref:Uncharacterized protein n=1 Tax=Hevea brasiliensis TaxID=3981 RepID=A0A6A6KDS9_HEVBR|nr:hypothetical protein GH714_017834 [Hevea brasiliensis]
MAFSLNGGHCIEPLQQLSIYNNTLLLKYSSTQSKTRIVYAHLLVLVDSSEPLNKTITMDLDCLRYNIIAIEEPLLPMISCPRRQSNDDGDKYSDDLSFEDSNQRSNEIGLSVSKSTDTPNLAITPYQEPAATMGSDTLVHVENSEEQGEQFIQLRCDDLSCETPKGDRVATLNDCSRKSNEESTGLSNFGMEMVSKEAPIECMSGLHVDGI